MSDRPKAFVAGGSGALGRSVCRALLDDGYEVHASATDAHHGLQEASELQDVTVHIGDFTDEGQVLRAFEEAGGPLDALVSTIGGYAGGALAGITGADVDRMTALNFKTTALVLRAAHPRLKGRPEGAGVVLVGARAAAVGGPGAALYAATKAAVVSLATSAAREWAEDGITVNAVLPSTMDTPANRRAMPRADFSRWTSTDDVARVIAFLVGPRARIISGAAIPVYGSA